MGTNTLIEDGISEAETPLLDDVVRSFVDFRGHTSVRSKSGYWKSASFIIGVEVSARCAYMGINSNLISYLTGPLGQPTAAAAANANAWTGTASLLPLLGAFIADSLLGRYRTILISASLYILGLGLLSLSAQFDRSISSDCKSEAYSLPCFPPSLEVIGFFFSLYLVAVAEGGIRPCLQAFGADQFDEEHETESKSKSSFFNWWFFSMCGGSFLALIVLNYIQENLSWSLGFGIPCFLMCFSLLVFSLGTKKYRFRKATNHENPFTRIARGFMKACDDDDSKTIIKLVPIWCSCLGYAIVISQIPTLFTKQGSTMNRHITRGIQIPPAALQSLLSFSVLLFIPIYDRVLVPAVEALTKKRSGISMLQRIGTGLVLSFLTMVVAALVERRRLAVVHEYGLVDEPTRALPMSVWWLAPQYVLFGISDVFVIVGLQELFYDQVPSDLKSVGLAMYLSIIGIGNFLSSFLIFFMERMTRSTYNDGWFSNDVNRARLDYFYWLLAGLGAVTTAAYAHLANGYVYKGKDVIG